jgi:Fe-Mn family superoxide dismutase
LACGNNYAGAVRRLNAIDKQFGALLWQATLGFAINGLKREELVAANAMILHEVYFDGLGGADSLGSPSVDPTGSLADAIQQAFGSIDEWRQQFIAMGRALVGGSGWVILSWSPRAQRRVNHWAADHAHTLADGVPILALDMYEQAYHLDFGADASGYVDA